jgi:hypothetical protein
MTKKVLLIVVLFLIIAVIAGFVWGTMTSSNQQAAVFGTTAIGPREVPPEVIGYDQSTGIKPLTADCDDIETPNLWQSNIWYINEMGNCKQTYLNSGEYQQCVAAVRAVFMKNLDDVQNAFDQCMTLVALPPVEPVGSGSGSGSSSFDIPVGSGSN